MGAVAPTLFGAIELLVNNQTAIFEDARLAQPMTPSSRSIATLLPSLMVYS